MSSLAFSPTDEELLSYYLYHKVVGEFTPPINLPVIDLYNMEPSLIWQQFGGIDGRDLHCFTVLNKKKTRVMRNVGSTGYTWSGESKSRQVFSSKDHTLIGTFKRFHYENPKLKNVGDDNISWIMFEYSLDPKVVSKGVVYDSHVLCKIRKRIVKKKNICKSGLTSTSRSVDVVDLTDQCCVNLDVGLKRDEIKDKLIAFIDLESSEFQKDFGPQTTNHPRQIMCGTAQDELYAHISKRKKLENQFCNYSTNLIQDEIETDLWKDLEPILQLEDIQSLSDSQFTEVCPLKHMELLDDDLYNLEYGDPSLMTQMELYGQNLPNVEFSYLCNELYNQNSNNVKPAKTSAPKKMDFSDQNLKDQNVNNLASADICPTTQVESYHPTLDVKEFAKLLLSLQDQ